jgi:hypothetical protein
LIYLKNLLALILLVSSVQYVRAQEELIIWEGSPEGVLSGDTIRYSDDYLYGFSLPIGFYDSLEYHHYRLEMIFRNKGSDYPDYRNYPCDTVNLNSTVAISINNYNGYKNRIEALNSDDKSSYCFNMLPGNSCCNECFRSYYANSMMIPISYEEFWGDRYQYRKNFIFRLLGVTQTGSELFYLGRTKLLEPIFDDGTLVAESKPINFRLSDSLINQVGLERLNHLTEVEAVRFAQLKRFLNAKDRPKADENGVKMKKYKRIRRLLNTYREDELARRKKPSIDDEIQRTIELLALYLKITEMGKPKTFVDRPGSASYVTHEIYLNDIEKRSETLDAYEMIDLIWKTELILN